MRKLRKVDDPKHVLLVAFKGTEGEREKEETITIVIKREHANLKRLHARSRIEEKNVRL